MWSDSIGSTGQCAEGLPLPEDYLLLVSENSTNGIDGTWKTVDSITGNKVAARGHTVDFNGFIWIKMMVLKGGGKIDEIEIFDISNGNDDTWLFVGTSITANAFKGPVPFKDFRYFIMDYVKEYNPKATPAFIRGGIGCLKSDGLAADLKQILEMAGGVNYLAIEIGTNDAQGGSPDNVKAFTANLQECIDECKAQKVEPIIARIPATNPEKASWQVHEAYLKAVDDLAKKNNLKPGPDLYKWFSQHPEELKDDGVHPNQRGGATILRLWAEAVYMLYKDAPTK
jgi:lysophospholipase L1-like esterase